MRVNASESNEAIGPNERASERASRKRKKERKRRRKGLKKEIKEKYQAVMSGKHNYAGKLGRLHAPFMVPFVRVDPPTPLYQHNFISLFVCSS